jgi:hypothetical protein
MSTILTRAQVERIVTAANTAPSPDNSQPWLFAWDGEALAITLDTRRATNTLDHRKRMSCLTLGGLLEAITIAAAAEGVAPRFELTPGPPGSRWATARFEPGASPHELAGALELRSTDRRAYRGGSLSAPVFDALRREGAREPGYGLRLLDRCPPELADYLRRSDAYVFRHEEVYCDVMSWIRFSQREVDATRDGASFRCLGYALPALPGIALLRSRWVQRFMDRSGLAVIPRVRLETQLASSAGVYAITAPSTSPLDLIQVGRLALRAWLRLNRAGYGVHPLSIASVFAHSFAEDQPAPRTLPAFVELFRRGPAILARAFEVDPGEQVIWLFRTGLSPAPPPQLRTRRLPLEKIFTWTAAPSA